MRELLDAFREDAERVTPVPAFEPIEAAGRTRRRRRHAVGGALAACVLAATGFVLVADSDDTTPQPAERTDESSRVTPYPGSRMTTLEKGTYQFELGPSLPAVRFTLPSGWNSWLGPNRSPDLVPGQQGSGQNVDWYVGLLVLDIQSIAQRGCSMRNVGGDDPEDLVQALANAADLRVTSGPERTVRFGRPVTHVRLEEQARSSQCLNDVLLVAAEGSGITYLGRGTTYDAWVVDAGDRPLLVWATWTRGTPRAEVDGLLGVVDSIEVADRE
jgi:hypothetical protein